MGNINEDKLAGLKDSAPHFPDTTQTCRVCVCVCVSVLVMAV